MSFWTRWLRLMTFGPQLAKRVSFLSDPKRRPTCKMRLERLEDRTLLSASVWTDKPDYAPGSTALINGSDFQVGEVVQFQVLRTDGVQDGPPGNLPWYVQDGDNSFVGPRTDAQGNLWYPDLDGTVDGNFQTTWNVYPEYLGASLQLTATGQTSGLTAQTTFTDKITPTVATPSANLPSPQTYGTVVTFTTTVIGTGNNLPTGTVTFKDGSKTLDTVSSSSNDGVHTATYTFSISTLTATSHNISAAYNPAGDPNYNGANSGSLSYVVNPKALTVSGITANNKVYDGTSSATLNTGSAALVGVVNGDTITLNTSGATGSFSDKNVGTAKPVTISGLTISGTAASNYTLSQPTATANVSARSITVTAAANTKTYDGTTSAGATPTITSGTLASGDTANFTESYNTRNAGSGLILTPAGSVNDGNSGNNYNVTFVQNTNGVINKAALTITAQANTKIYDGTTSASVTPTVSGLKGTDTVTGLAEAYNNKNAGTGKTLSVANYLVNDGNSGNNYAVTTVNSTSGVINQAPLTITASGVNKVYDGTTSATVTLSDNRVSGDVVNDSYSTATFDTKNVGTGKTVSVSGIAISGADASNYTFNTTATTTADVTPTTLTVTANNASRLYGAPNPSFTASFSGFQNGETLASSGVTGSPSLTTSATSTSPVGSYAITATQGSLTALNYTFAFTNGTLTVNKAHLTVTADPKSKTYDGQVFAPFTATLSGFVNGESSSVVSGSAGFSGAATTAVNAGSYTITPTQGTLSAANYDFTTFTNGTLTIDKAAPAVQVTGSHGVYDGNAHAASGSVIGVGGVILAPPTFTYNGSSAAPVNAGRYAVVGSYAGDANYNPATDASQTIVIDPASLTLTADNLTKVYGAPLPTLTGTLSGVVNGDGITASYATSATASSDVGTYAITPSLNDPNNRLANYVVTSNPGLLTITRADQTISFAALANKTYGDADFTVSAFATSGLPVTFTASGNATIVGNLVHVTGAGIVTITAHQVGNGNYNAALDVSQTFTVNRANLTVSADNQTKVYGAALPTLTGTLSGVVNGDNVTATFGTNATAASDVGSYAITPTLNDPDGRLENYNVTSINGTLVITKADQVISWANPAPIVYGTALDANQLNATVSVVGPASAGTLTYSLPFGTVLDAGAGQFLTVNAAATNNYNAASKTVTIDVTPAPLLVSAADASRVYGSANPLLSGTLTGVVNGDAITASFVTSATASNDVGSYAITPVLADPNGRLSNYNVTSLSGTLSVTPAPLAVTAKDASKVYGQANPAFSVQYNGFVLGQGASVLSGTLAFSTPATTASHVGSYAITPSGLSSGNYALSFGNGILSVTPAPLTITVQDATKVYGQVNPVFGVQYSGFVLGEDPSVLGGTLAYTTAATPASSVGNYPISASGLTSTDYALSYVDGTLAVTPAPLAVTPADTTRVYGDANPAFTGSVLGLQNGDAITASFGTVATPASNVGTYDVTASLSDPDSKLGNYSVTLKTGHLTITPAPLSVLAADATKVYGSANPLLTGTLSGVVNGDAITASFVTSATASSDVGSFAITPVLADPNGRLSNYTITATNGTLSVTPAPLTVTANDATKVYGQTNPAFSVHYNGFVLGQDSSVLGGNLAFTTPATAASHVGSYAITPSGLTSSNYALSFVDGALSVTPKDLTVVADDKEITYGDSLPIFTALYLGFVNGDGPANLNGSLIFSGPAVSAMNAGSYVLTPGGQTSNDYALTFVNGTLTIDKATPTVHVTGAHVVYNGMTHAATGTVIGVGGAILATPTFTYNGSSAAPVNAGSYAVLGSYAGDANYNPVSDASQTIVIDQAPLTVTADNQTKVYGDPNPIFTAHFDGFVAGENASVLGGTLAFSTPATTSSHVGSYAITPSGLTSSNYALSFVNGTLGVTPAPLTITVQDATKVYGQPNPAFSVQYSGFVLGEDPSVLGGTLVSSTAATATSAVGSYVVSASGLTSSDYALSYVDGHLVVTPAPLVVTPGNATRVYGDSNPVFTGSVVGLQNGDAITASYGSVATPASNVGTYDVTASLSDPTGKLSNYSVTLNKGHLTITPAALTVSAANATKVYGSANPVLTGSLIGVVNGDAITASFVTSATASSDVGSYAITPVLADPNGRIGNYTVSSTNGTLSVTPAPLTVTANDATKVYGQTNPAFSVHYNGFVLGQDSSVLGGTLAFSTPATAASHVGSYAITPSGLSSSNYGLTFVDGTLSVTPAPLTITANNQTMIYGGAMPTLTASFSGLVNGETPGSYNPTLSTVPASSHVGTYAISVSGAADPDYAIQYVNGTLTINPATLTVTADDKARVYGQANPVFTAHYAGFVNGDTTACLTGSPNLATSAGLTSPVGSYVITSGTGTLNAHDYVFAFVNGTLTVGKASTSTALTESAATPLFGVDSETFSANVTINAPGSGSATGNVRFVDDVSGAILGTVALSNGIASLTTSALAVGNHHVTATYLGDGNCVGSAGAVSLEALAPASVSGTVFEDFNEDGLVDFGENGIAGVAVTLTGTDDLGHTVKLALTTDRDGAYVFQNLRPGQYTVTETQPAGYRQGINSIGTAGGTVAADQFFINLAKGVDGLNYNFGEQAATTGAIQKGQTAGIGFWNNKNGQALINSLNGGSTSTQLGNWLAATFVNTFGAGAGANNLAGKSNAYVAAFFQKRFLVKAQKLDAQVLATALAVYVTNQTLAGTTATTYGFLVTPDGVGVATYNVGCNGSAFGVANNTTMTVLDLLLAADRQAVVGVLYNGDVAKRNQANDVFSAINQAGNIS
jgi:hypothetical protein